MSSDDANDELGLPPLGLDAVATGAAADSARDWERLKGLPRLLRYAMLVCQSAGHLAERLIADIEELCPQLPQTRCWAVARDVGSGLELAAELDRQAVVQDEPRLRSLADCVRLLSLQTPHDARHFEDYRRVGMALLQAFQLNAPNADEALRCDLERFVFGWAALPASTSLLSRQASAADNAAYLGKVMAEYRVAATKARVMRAHEERRKKEEAGTAAKTSEQTASPEPPQETPEDHLIVARMSPDELDNGKLKDIIRPLKPVINVALPLVKAPPLHEVRSALLFEFPHAREVIDFALADLVGRATVRLRPLLLVGDPGAGKSRFARRLGELLGLSIWRTDATRADGAVFGGTDRRWSTLEPCHPFLAVSQGKFANPLVLVDELDKAGTRNDYGRLWDCLLPFLEAETNSRYPDPALQVNLDLSQISYIATANSIEPLPSPLRDRLRVVRMPKPTAGDLDALLPAVLADLAKERGIDQSWMVPLDGLERVIVAQHWRGGSVRALRRVLEAVLREREVRATRN